MRILIDFTQIPLERVGVGVYAENLIKQFCSKPSFQFFLVAQNDDPICKIKYSHIRIIRVPAFLFRRLFFRLILEQLVFPFLVLRYRINIVHSLHYSFPLFPFLAKKIVTIHDLTFFLFPELHVPFKRIYFKFFIKLSTLLADNVICVSESTKNDLCNLFPRVLNKASVVPLGKDDRFNNEISKENILFINKKYGITAPYILFIGTLEPRKNIIKLISAFQKLLKTGFPHKLVIVGKKGWYFDSIFMLVEKLGLENEIIFTGFVAEADKPFIISGADLFVYPSIYEGFGIPVLEAISCGIPTITSNISSMPEVAGEAGILINPEDEDAIFMAINDLLTNKDFYSLLKDKSVVQAEKFNWETTAQKTINLYSKLAK